MYIRQRLSIVFGLFMVVLCYVTPPAVHANEWPSEKPIRIVVPWPAGSGTDNVARLIATELSSSLNQQVIVDNRGGAGGIIGMQHVSKASPDGYTLMLTSSSYGYLINKATSGVDLMDDFSPVALVATFESALTVNPQLSVNSMEELLAYAKAHPGELNYSSTGVGGFGHMNTELLKYMTDVDIVHVPYQGGAEATTSVIAGHTQIYLGSLVTTTSHIKSGRLKLLAIGGAERNPEMPDIPTISETVPGYETSIWFGMFAPRGTPAEILEKLHVEINEALDSDNLRANLEAQGATIIKRSSEEFGNLVESELAAASEVIDGANIK